MENNNAPKTVVCALMFDCEGKAFRLAFDSEEGAQRFANDHGYDLSFTTRDSLDRAEKRGYDY